MSIINTPMLKTLWQDAQDYPEWAATKLWEYVFNRVIFRDDKWVVSSQQPPTRAADDKRRVDLVVQKQSSKGDLQTLLFLEAKRAEVDASVVQIVEYQAFTAACAYYIETGKEQIWTMTCVGSAARLWIFSAQSEYLIPFVPSGEGLAEKSEYLELATHGTTIVDALEYVKKHSIPPSHLLETEPSPRPMHAELPENWHDHEVQQLDAWQRSHMPPAAESMDMSEDPSHATDSMPQSYMGFGQSYDNSSSWATDDGTQGQANMASGQYYDNSSSWATDDGTQGQANMASGQYYGMPPSWAPDDGTQGQANMASGQYYGMPPSWAPDDGTQTRGQSEPSSGQVDCTSGGAPQGGIGGPSTAESVGQHPSSGPAKKQEKKYVEVEAKYKSHALHPYKKPEVEFEHNGRKQVTDKKDWKKEDVNGSRVWTFKGKKTIYWTCSKLE
ncbi:hypothetical protein BFJ68_g15965 [Fusarium oxysporum]|uniref:Uncharacterized protein n=1 Tax=Fusarium oxysporum TaxID=5507 RepID=A0A420PI34_FUSOX|nr:hypothetical protein BFJ68_g15965 [Fusarium oxysporum]